MEKEPVISNPVISHIVLMLNHLDEGAIRAVYMVVKELYTLKQTLLGKC